MACLLSGPLSTLLAIIGSAWKHLYGLPKPLADRDIVFAEGAVATAADDEEEQEEEEEEEEEKAATSVFLWGNTSVLV